MRSDIRKWTKKDWEEAKKHKWKILRKDLVLETCGQRASTFHIGKKKKYKNPTHKNGCYIRFQGTFGKHPEIEFSEERHDCVIDRDKKGRVVGVEFYEGI